MSSDRLRAVYASARWRALCPRIIARAGGRCEYTWSNAFGETLRCTKMDKKWGGGESLTINHKNPYGDPYNEDELEALCRRHHGMVDGGRAGRNY